MSSRRIEPMQEGATLTPLELFFDLVFVYALTQVTALMATDVTLSGMTRGLVVLALVWWNWVGYAWLGNVVRADEGLPRYAFIAVMAATFVLALSLPETFADLPGGLNGPLTFVCCYGVVRLAHLALFVVAARDDAKLRRQLLVWAPTLIGSIALLALGAVLGSGVQLALWLLALVSDIGGTWAVGAGGWSLPSASHFAERHGLVVLIALGESIVAIGVGVTHVPVSVPVVAASTLGIGLLGSLWWIYFDVTAAVGEHRLAGIAEREQRAKLARDAYSLLHLPMVAGIILAALGLKKVFEYIGGEAGHTWRDAQAGLGAYALPVGVAVYLLAHLAFRRRIGDATPWAALAAPVALLALSPLAERLSVLLALVAVAVVPVALIGYQTGAGEAESPAVA